MVELINNMGTDVTVVNAARVSHLGESKGTDLDSKLIKYLLEHKHWSPFEHVFFTFKVKCPLFVRSQWMRHKSWSFNEVSRRYTSEDIDFFIPTEFRKQDDNNKQGSSEIKYFDQNFHKPWAKIIKHHVEMSLKLYNDMIEAGIAREQARVVLPQNMNTTFYASCNLRSLLHFLESRLAVEAQLEIKKYAEQILKIVDPIVPITINHWKNLTNQK